MFVISIFTARLLDFLGYLSAIPFNQLDIKAGAKIPTFIKSYLVRK